MQDDKQIPEAQMLLFQIFFSGSELNKLLSWSGNLPRSAAHQTGFKTRDGQIVIQQRRLDSAQLHLNSFHPTICLSHILPIGLLWFCRFSSATHSSTCYFHWPIPAGSNKLLQAEQFVLARPGARDQVMLGDKTVPENGLGKLASALVYKVVGVV